MRKMLSLCLVLVCCLQAAAPSVPGRAEGAEETEAEWLWPIAGMQAGEGIIAQPGDKIGNERVKASLFIAAPEGTPVVCPADALVKGCLLSYKKSLHFSYALSFDKPFDEAVADAKTGKAGRKIDPGYICADILLSVDSREIYIGGLRCDTAIASGTVLHRGDTIGTVAYAYHRLAQPCIVFASNSYSMPYDPMTPFGLASTFVRPHLWRTGERRALIAGAVLLAALLFWLVFHIIYKVKDRRRRAYFQALMESHRPSPADSAGHAAGDDADLQPTPGEAPFRQRMEAARHAFQVTPSARVLMEAAAGEGRMLTADERTAILADINRIFADIMIDVKKSSLKTNGQELLLCMLSVLHVPTAVMADCLNVGESTIRTRKTRLKAKIPEELYELFFGKVA